MTNLEELQSVVNEKVQSVIIDAIPKESTEQQQNHPYTSDSFPSDTTSSSSSCTTTEIQLYQQLLYYFSQQNLQTDVYLQTLRSLNDGCVPINIIANFSKIKSICIISKNTNVQTSDKVLDVPTTSTISTTTGTITTNIPSTNSGVSSSRIKVEKVLHDEKLRVDTIVNVLLKQLNNQLQLYRIDTITGKRIIGENIMSSSPPDSTNNTILAVGLKEGLIFTNTQTTPTVAPATESSVDHNEDTSSSWSSSNTNTLILRDVASSVSEQEIYSLLEVIDDCPLITSITPDVGNCWFITFDTTDRYDLIRVMMQLRMLTYPSNDEPVMVRLRASIIQPSNRIRVDSYSHPIHQTGVSPSTSVTSTDPITPTKKKRRKKKRTNKKKNKTSTATSVATTNTTTTTTASDTSIADSQGKQHNLDLSRDDDFPSLQRQFHHHRVSSVGTSVDMVNDSINGSDDDDDDEESNSGSCSNTSRIDTVSDACYDDEVVAIGEEEHANSNDNVTEVDQEVTRLSSKLQGLQHSDTASTATTASSNASSNGSCSSSNGTVKNTAVVTATTVEHNGPIIIGGYAAAVRRSSVQQKHVPSMSVGTTVTPTNSFSTQSKPRQEKDEPVSEGITSVVDSCKGEESLSVSDNRNPAPTLDMDGTATGAPSNINQWGLRRSFADVIRESSAKQ